MCVSLSIYIYAYMHIHIFGAPLCDFVNHAICLPDVKCLHMYFHMYIVIVVRVP